MAATIERVDFTRVEPHHHAIDARLHNWALYVRDRRPTWMAPIWRLGKPLGRQWNAPEPKVLVDPIDGNVIEQAVSNLPEPHRSAVRWSYVYRTQPARMARSLGVRYDTLARLVVDARNMLLRA